MTDEQINLLPGRSSGATFVRNGMMYIYGGIVSRSALSTKFTSIAVSDQDGSLIYSDVPQANPIPMAYSQAVMLPDNNRLLMFGGYTNNLTLYTNKLLVYEYRFDQQTWREAPVLPHNNQTFPVNRKEFTATLGSDGKVYIAGGFNLVSAFSGAGMFIMGDLWSYDPATGQFVDLSQPLLPNYMIGHSAIALPDSKIIFIMGTMGYHSRTAHPQNPLELCNSSLIYDIGANKWSKQSLQGDKVPWLREGVSTILGPDNSTIYIFGGIRNVGSYFYNSLADFAILDTATWTWCSTDSILGVPPTARYEANGALLNNRYFVLANGRIETFWYNDVYMLDLAPENKSPAWVQNVKDPIPNSDAASDSNILSGSTIAGIVIGTVFGAILLGFILWNYWSALYTYFIWDPRTGEPLWTEVSHLLSKAVLGGLFVAFLAFLIHQVVTSPISTITLSTSASKVSVPDIRFCFDGWTQGSIGCQTDTGTIEDCATAGYLRRLNMTKHRPFFIDGQVNITSCFLFTAPDSFQLGDPKHRQFNTGAVGDDNGYRLQFLFYGVATKSSNPNGTISQISRVHVSLYPRGRNPNLAYYFGDTTQQLSQSDIQVWLNGERNDLQTSNTYSLELGAYSSIIYQLQDHLYLQNTGWNNIGFAPTYNSVPEVTTAYRPGISTPVRVESFAKNILDIYPSTYSKVTLREQKIYTILSAIGSAGGLFSLLITLDAFLFGVRPRSPWGMIHRLVPGSARDSLLAGLRKQFGFLTSTIPFINPVRANLLSEKQQMTHAIFPSEGQTSTYGEKYQTAKENALQLENAQIQDQLNELQKRVQLMELMFKSYYISDELFANLDSAVRQHKKYTFGNDNRPMNHEKYLRERSIDEPATYTSAHIIKHINPPPANRDDNSALADDHSLPNVSSGIQLHDRRMLVEERTHLVDKY
ncbi:hypothetical protein BJV82DRAFT_663240 [Fennellomyces sp. T-0311]|nr:hypothetical protein BJV82DRAFT_663240 [Fennellomyces sp. T-0311]